MNALEIEKPNLVSECFTFLIKSSRRFLWRSINAIQFDFEIENSGEFYLYSIIKKKNFGITICSKRLQLNYHVTIVSEHYIILINYLQTSTSTPSEDVQRDS